MQRVFVLSKDKAPLMPCHPARARQLLSAGKARMIKRYPLTIQLQQETTNHVQPTHLKIDPGSKTTGIALVALFQQGYRVIYALNLSHRGHQVKEALDSRRSIRRSRRDRKTRYRKARFLNRRRSEHKGWLPPSLMSRVYNTQTWAKRLKKILPMTQVDIETVRFDTQLMQNPAIEGAEYQQGSLKDWELREYLLYRHHHTCAYCNGLSKDTVLEREHIHPKSRGGSNRLSNQVIACRTCNSEKSHHLPQNWLKILSSSSKKIDKVRAGNLEKILKGIRPSLKDTAAVNATRYKIGEVLKQDFDNVQFWSGGRTRKNRSEQGYQKDHWVDAVCVGESGEQVFIPQTLKPLLVKAMGHGHRQFTRVDKFGFPRTAPKPRYAEVEGFNTGDIILARVLKGKKQGNYQGRVAVRSSGYFNIKTETQTVQGISYQYCKKIHCADGYHYD